MHFAWIGYGLTVFSGHALCCKQAKCNLNVEGFAGFSLKKRNKQLNHQSQECLSEISDVGSKTAFASEQNKMMEQTHRSENTGRDNMIRLSERMVFSDSFKPLYSEGMALVEEAAAYLDEEGKEAARALSPQAATLYAAESMRLTSRLMHIASWLLLLRASRSGDMSRDMVAREKAKVSLETLSAGESAKGWQELPQTFRDMIARSLHLQDRVRCMDGDSYHKQIRELVECKGNAVSDQIVLLRTAFGGN